MVQEDVAGLGANVRDTISGLVTHLNHISIGTLGYTFNLASDFWFQLLVCCQIDFSQHDNQWFGLEKWFDIVEEGDLMLNCVPTAF